MKKIVLSLLSCFAGLTVMAQMTVTGISPASIAGNYNFTFGDSDNGWGVNLDYTAPGNYVQGELVLVEDGTPGTNPQGKPISQEGCNPLTNAAAVNGKIAVVYRNTCEFGTKAKRAADAGAIGVIILNRDAEVIGMAAGTDGANVTVPVVMLSSIDGDALVSAMNDGPVTMFIGSKAGLYAQDLGFIEDLILTPFYNGVHTLLAQNGSDFNFDLGMRVYNYGSANVTDGAARAVITGPNGTTVYDETVNFTLNGLSGTNIDSVDIFPGEALSFPQFSLSAYPMGEYTLTYTLFNGTEEDEFPGDNSYSINFVVNDQYFSRSRLDATTYKPIYESLTYATDPAAPAPPYSQLRYCMSFRDPNASRLAALGLVTKVGVDTALTSNLKDHTLFVEVYEWNDVVDVINNTGGYDQLVSVGNAEHTFLNQVVEEEVYFQFDDPVMLIDNKAYLFCVVDYGQKLRIAYDRSVDFNANYQHYNMLPSPIFASPNSNPTPWFGGGFGPDLTPAFGIRAVDVNSASVNSLVKLEGKAYPNPTTDAVKLNIPMDGKATVAVTDLTGRTVATHNVTFLDNQATISMGDLKSGMYIINVEYANGSKSTFNVVRK